ncbi:MAG: LrgB family protein [Clostridia bacterium]|jgi:predicted murein hydrolase (TIGR00659 family)|nr:LrgB family protein [Clostridia bacterium]
MTMLTSNPVFGIFLTLVVYRGMIHLKNKFNYPLNNPLLTGIISIIFILSVFRIPYENYKAGGDYIHFFLGPATVILAAPLYKQLDLLKKNLLPILTGVFAGSLFALISIGFLSKIFGFDQMLTASLLPKSVTMPIGIEVADSLGGISSITVISIVVTGIIGAVFAEKILLLFKIKDKVAQGISIGTASHALGTTKAIEMGEVQGGMSGLAIGLAGFFTALMAPFILTLFF